MASSCSPAGWEWMSISENTYRQMYKVRASSSWAQTLSLPSSCPWTHSPAAGTRTHKLPRLQPHSYLDYHTLSQSHSWPGFPRSQELTACAHTLRKAQILSQLEPALRDPLTTLLPGHFAYSPPHPAWSSTAATHSLTHPPSRHSLLPQTSGLTPAATLPPWYTQHAPRVRNSIASQDTEQQIISIWVVIFTPLTL